MIYKVAFLYFILSVSLLAQELSGELVLKSFQHTYPHKVGKVSFIDGDWAIRVGDETFYWAQGRLLPAGLRNNWESYREQGFFAYPKDIPDPQSYSPEEIEALRSQGTREARLDRDDPHNGFQAALYGGMTRAEIETHQVKMVFLGKNIVIHEDITEALSRVDQTIKSLAKEDPEIVAFMASINSIGGYNWRQIQGTRRMSYHSWGLALDIQPKQLGNKVIYWLWERIFNNNWMLVPLERRWSPPAGVIQAFEHEGFIWGGRWALYDNMHFEYRPELLEINRVFAPETSRFPVTQTQNAPDLHHVYPGNIPRKGSFFQRILIYLGLKK
jgi:hypothetical protein